MTYCAGVTPTYGKLKKFLIDVEFFTPSNNVLRGFVNELQEHIFHTFVYIYENCIVNMGLRVSKKSVLPTSFGRPRFRGDLFLQKFLFDVICLKICHNDVAFFLTTVDDK